MATITSFPPELLLDILTDAVEVEPFERGSSRWSTTFRSRSQQLGQLSLVHPCLTDPARLLMVQHVRADRYVEPERDLGFQQLVSTLSSPSWNTFKVKYLSIQAAGYDPSESPRRGPFPNLLVSLSDIRPFLHIVWMWCEGGYLDLHVLSHIRTLRTLYLLDVWARDSASNRGTASLLPSITRFGIGDSSDWTDLFKKALPNVLHLAVPSRTTLDKIPDETSTKITSLALLLINGDEDDPPISRDYPNLLHFSLREMWSEDLPHLFGLSLQTLSLRSEITEQLIAVARGNHGSIKAETVYLYGEREEWVGIYSEQDLDLFEWCEGTPPYSSFRSSSP